MSTNRWITLKNAAIATGKSRRTIHKLIVRDQLTTSTEGRETIVLLTDLMRAIDKTPGRGGNRHVAIDSHSQEA